MFNKVSIVIPTKNGGNTFREVLLKLKNQKFLSDYDIIVIDSGSSDGTVEFAEKFGASILKIGPKEFNHGETRNKAIEFAKSEIVVLMTQDAVPADTHLIKCLVKPFSDPLVAGTYARQLPRIDADILTKRNLNRWLTGGSEPYVNWIQDRKVYDKMSPLEKYMFCNFDNVCSAIRKNIWRNIPFQTTAFGEDIEWGKRVLEAGWKIAYEPSAKVIHSHNRSLSYEYKRTYMCHQKLFELFGLRTVPNRSALLKSIFYQTLADTNYVINVKPRLSESIRMLGKVPFIAVAAVTGQYRGAHDEMSGKRRKLNGV